MGRTPRQREQVGQWTVGTTGHAVLLTDRAVDITIRLGVAPGGERSVIGGGSGTEYGGDQTSGGEAKVIDDVIVQAGGVLQPFLGAGASAAAASAGGAAGAELAGAARKVLSRLRIRRDEGDPANQEELVDALRRAVAEGTVEIAELQQVVRLSGHHRVHNEMSGEAGVNVQGHTISIGDVNVGTDK